MLMHLQKEHFHRRKTSTVVSEFLLKLMHTGSGISRFLPSKTNCFMGSGQRLNVCKDAVSAQIITRQ